METLRRDRGRRANLALLVLLPLAVLTGLFSNTIGTEWLVRLSTIHGIVAIAVAAVSPWKSLVIRHGLRRWTRSTWVSIALLFLVLSTLATGVVHATGYQGRLGPLTVMQVHVGGALTAVVLAILHYRAHPMRLRRTDLDRRTFLRTLGLGTAAALGWFGLEAGLDLARLPGGDRRFTGSHERGSFDPEAMPVTSWFDDSVQHIDAGAWSLRVAGRDVSLGDLAAFPQDDVTAVLDCTSGWYSEQVWRGVRLDRLVEPGGHRSVAVRSATGYTRRFPMTDLAELWLVTHAGDEPLSAGHGFPARIIAPGRRGFWWVKWVTGIEPSDVPWWLQLPFPAS